ncbi:MAG: hypothetical protein ABIS28_09065 [Caldimonas sp.]
MKKPSLIVVPVALVLALASTASAAEDKSAVSKPATTLSKSAKQKSPATPQDTEVKTVKQGTEKEAASSAAQSKPVSERSYEGCEHSKSSDA